MCLKISRKCRHDAHSPPTTGDKGNLFSGLPSVSRSVVRFTLSLASQRLFRVTRYLFTLLNVRIQ